MAKDFIEPTLAHSWFFSLPSLTLSPLSNPSSSLFPLTLSKKLMEGLSLAAGWLVCVHVFAPLT